MRKRANSPSTTLIIRPPSLRIKHRLRKSQPAGRARGGILKVRLRSGHGRHAPEALIVIAHTLRPVARHHVEIFAYLCLDALGRDVVVGGVARVMPVIDQCPPHGSGFPPVV